MTIFDTERTVVTDAPSARKTAKGHPIRPLTVHAPQAELDQLRIRFSATRWSTKELVEDRSQGVQLGTLRELARYWTTEYDWRKCETRLNALPQCWITTRTPTTKSPAHSSTTRWQSHPGQHPRHITLYSLTGTDTSADDGTENLV
jgi:hypothetical protein